MSTYKPSTALLTHYHMVSAWEASAGVLIIELVVGTDSVYLWTSVDSNTESSAALPAVAAQGI